MPVAILIFIILYIEITTATAVEGIVKKFIERANDRSADSFDLGGAPAIRTFHFIISFPFGVYLL